MKKRGAGLLAFALASALTATTVLPTYPVTSVYAEEQAQQEINWTFSGIHGEKTATGILLSGDGDSFGISDVKKTNNYSIKAKLTQGEEDGAIGVIIGAKDVNKPSDGSRVVNVNPASGEVRLFQFPEGANKQDSKFYDALKNQNEYQFELTVSNGRLTAKINDITVVNKLAMEDSEIEGNIGFISWKESI